MSRFSKSNTASIPELLKILKLKTNSLKRLLNEMKNYIVEKNNNELKLLNMNNSTDQYERKKQEEFVQESIQVLNATRQNFLGALETLQLFLNENENSDDIKSTEELKTAEALIESAEQYR